MLFKDYHVPQIRSGEKTVTRREWSENYAGPSIGTVVAATTELFVSDEDADCYIRITDRYRQSLGEMTDDDAQAEGDYGDLAAFRDGYERVYGEGAWDPEKVVDVVEFEYVGRSRPTEQETLVSDGAGEHAAPGTAILVSDDAVDTDRPFWHHSVEYDGYHHVTACGLEIDVEQGVNDVLMELPDDWNDEVGPSNRCPECHGSVRSLH